MLIPMVYRSGEEIRSGDRVLLHGEPGEIQFVHDGETNPEGSPAGELERGVMIAEPTVFGILFLAEKEIPDYEDLVFVSRSVDQRTK
jgi:hypothetical protein